jgi:exodeoxyribonuclease VII large subunit
MAKPFKSQWEFGELFPAASSSLGRKILSVAELTFQIRRVLEKEVGQVWVTGEITNLRVQSSGHVYFTLKDAAAQLSCVLFRGELQVDRTLLQDGRKVILGGDLTVYDARGQYQMRITSVEVQGAGALQLAFEKLKQKLKAEGLFALERKRTLPRYPQRIGLVTSPTGAAIRDVLHVIRRRNPGLEMVLAPCRVQGDGAAAEIAAAIRLLNEFNSKKAGTAARDSGPPPSATGSGSPGAYLDLILLTRGGGSLEDLWAFNEEVVARAVFHSNLPIVSAVGHEIDFTISDFVADLRAATPSAAAEIITEGVFSSCQFVAEANTRMHQLAKQQLKDKEYILAQTGQRLARRHPRRRVQDWQQRLDDLQTGLVRCVQQSGRRQRLAWRNLFDRLARVRPALLLNQRREVFHLAQQRLHELTRHCIRESKAQLEQCESRLRLLGPQQVLSRGYSITMDAQSGAVVRDAREVRRRQVLKTRLKTGEVRSRVEEE